MSEDGESERLETLIIILFAVVLILFLTTMFGAPDAPPLPGTDGPDGCLMGSSTNVEVVDSSVVADGGVYRGFVQVREDGVTRWYPTGSYDTREGANASIQRMTGWIQNQSEDRGCGGRDRGWPW